MSRKNAFDVSLGHLHDDASSSTLVWLSCDSLCIQCDNHWVCVCVCVIAQAEYFSTFPKKKSRCILSVGGNPPPSVQTFQLRKSLNKKKEKNKTKRNPWHQNMRDLRPYYLFCFNVYPVGWPSHQFTSPDYPAVVFVRELLDWFGLSNSFLWFLCRVNSAASMAKKNIFMYFLPPSETFNTS